MEAPDKDVRVTAPVPPSGALASLDARLAAEYELKRRKSRENIRNYFAEGSA